MSAQILITLYAIGGSFFFFYHIIGLCEVSVICVYVCCDKDVIPMFMYVLHTDVSCVCVCVDGCVYVCACACARAYAHVRVCVLRTAVSLHWVAFNKDNLHVRTHSLCYTHTHTHTHIHTHLQTHPPTHPPIHSSTHLSPTPTRTHTVNAVRRLWIPQIPNNCNRFC